MKERRRCEVIKNTCIYWYKSTDPASLLSPLPLFHTVCLIWGVRSLIHIQRWGHLCDSNMHGPVCGILPAKLAATLLFCHFQLKYRPFAALHAFCKKKCHISLLVFCCFCQTQLTETRTPKRDVTNAVSGWICCFSTWKTFSFCYTWPQPDPLVAARRIFCVWSKHVLLYFFFHLILLSWPEKKQKSEEGKIYR